MCLQLLEPLISRRVTKRTRKLRRPSRTFALSSPGLPTQNDRRKALHLSEGSLILVHFIACAVFGKSPILATLLWELWFSWTTNLIILQSESSAM